MKTKHNKQNDYQMTFIQKLSLVLGTRQFMNYLLPAFLIITLTGLLFITGIFAEGYLCLGALLFLSSVVIVCLILTYGVKKVWKDIFE